MLATGLWSNVMMVLLCTEVLRQDGFLIFCGSSQCPHRVLQQYSTFDSSKEESNEDLKMGSSSVVGELKSSGEITTSRSESVPGLGNIPTTHNPLFNVLLIPSFMSCVCIRHLLVKYIEFEFQ
eukprot:g3277.t1